MTIYFRGGRRSEARIERLVSAIASAVNSNLMCGNRYLAAALAALLLPAACAGGGVGQISDGGADWLAGEVASEVASPPQVALSGRLVIADGEGVPDSMLILCGEVEGKEVCKLGYSAGDGSFLLAVAGQGWEHLQILPYGSTEATGIRYGGASLDVELPAPPGELELGEILLPVVEEAALVVVAEGGQYQLGDLLVELAPGSLVFPGLEDEGWLGAVAVSPDDVPFSLPGLIQAYAFHPFNCRPDPPATVHIPEPPGGFGTKPEVFLNATLEGGLVPAEPHTEPGGLSVALPELTWLLVASSR